MRKISQVFFTLLIIFLCSSYAFSQSNNENKLVVVLIDRLNLEDIDNMSFLKKLAADGAIGLMNTRGYGHSNEFSSCATIGSGTRTDATFYTSRSYKLDNDNYEIYKRRTGFSTQDNQIANLDIVKLIELNKKNNYNPFIGALGNSLKEGKIKSVIIGNSDIDNKQFRLSVLIGMDEHGLVDNGEIESEVIENDPSYPFGLKTNYEYLYEKFNEINKTGNFIIIELGDLNRLDAYKSNMTDEMYILYRDKILNDIDIFIQKIYNLIDLNKSKLLIFSPYPSSMALEFGKRLTPIIIVDKDDKQGILTSFTTRRKGIIGNVDIAPYIANYFRTSLDKFTGKPFYILKESNNLAYLRKLNTDISFLYRNRTNILYSFAIYEIIVSVLCFILIQINKRELFRYIEYLLLSTITVPFSLLILPIFSTNNLFYNFILIIGISLILTIISIVLRRQPIDSIIFLSGITSIGLIIDLYNNSKLMKVSFLGYDPIIGARYYGIGNEYMGILISSCLVFITSLLDRLKIHKLIAMLFLLFVAYVIGYPELGANVGGMITAIFSFMIVILWLNNKKLKLKYYGLIFLVVLLLLFMMSFIDLYFTESKSHLANALNRIYDEGMSVVYSIIIRKISMNLKLFRATIWSKVLVTTMMFLTVLFYRPFGIAKKVFNKYTNLAKGLLGILIACIVGFLVNDSGVVAAATCIIFLGMTLMYLIVNEIKSN